MPTNLSSVGIAQEEQDAVTQLPDSLFRKRGSRKVNSRTGSRLSIGTRDLFPMRNVFITRVTGSLPGDVRLFPERRRVICGNVSGYLWRCVMIFGGMTDRIYRNDPKHFPEWYDAFGGMPHHLYGNDPTHLPEWYDAFGGNDPTHFPGWYDAFGGMTERLYGNAPTYSPEWYDVFGGMTERLYGNDPTHSPGWYDAFGGMTERLYGIERGHRHNRTRSSTE